VKIATIVGARPQFIKAASVSHAIAVHNRTVHSSEETIDELVVHTGQHYDPGMSDIFFETFGLPPPKYNLGAGSGSHGAQIAKMIESLEEVLKQETPDLALLYGDTNSTLAGALMADRLGIPVAHVEAGLRSFNRRMPEECNRVIADRLSVLLFAPTKSAVRNLAREGITEGVHQVGDVMHEAAVFHVKVAEYQSKILQRLSLTPERYSLATIHRAENTDDPLRFQGILEGLRDVSRSQPLVWPVHPRTRKLLFSGQELDQSQDKLLLTEPVSYHDMLILEKSASVVLTDSGGVQKEAAWFGVPCVTLRDETEWVETVEAGRNELAGCRREKIRSAFEAALKKPRTPMQTEGNGTPPSTLIVQHLSAFCSHRALPLASRV
jgi:UDP-GlcNAc3NAcA epimerase